MRFPAAKLTPTRYILIVLQLLREDARFFLAGTLVAVALRLVFVLHFPGIVDDSRLYADIAMNWLQYGIYGITNSGHVVPTSTFCSACEIHSRSACSGLTSVELSL